MKLIIDIPDEAYNKLIKEQHLPGDLDIEYFIIHGTPLPKGHGITKEWKGQWVTLRCTNCHERIKVHISSRIGIYSLAEFKRKHVVCLKCGADMKVVRQRKENRGNE